MKPDYLYSAFATLIITAATAVFFQSATFGESVTGKPTDSTRSIVSSDTVSPGIPVRLHIDRLGINAPIERVGTASDGTMGVPLKWENAGWFERGPRPGEPGNAVLDGHLDSTTGPAAFWELQKIKAGEEIKITDDRGQVFRFIVSRVATINATPDQHELDAIFDPSASGSRLNLITCTGKWDYTKKQYSNRLVVYSTLVGI